MASSLILNQWQVYCTGAGNHGKQQVWRDATEGPPTHCPKRDTDPIDPDKIQIVYTSSQKYVKIANENGVTGGNFNATSRKLVITPDPNPQTFTFTFPMNISVFHLRFTSEEVHRGDDMECIMAPETNIGKIMQPVTGGPGGDTTIHVQSATIAILQVGYYVTLSGGGYKDDVGRVLEIDGAANTIVVEKTSSRSYSSTGAGTDVLLSVKYIATYYFGCPEAHSIGHTNYDSSFIRAGTPIVFTYNNRNAQAKGLILRIDHKY